MDAANLIEQLDANARRIAALVEGVSQEWATWRPDEASWSILEVINHLYDEERLDFRVRLTIILTDPQEEWPPIDPAGWVTARQYNARQIAPSLQNFLDERRASLTWLKSLENPHWNALCTTALGSMTAGDMFSAWVAHDTLHMRQLVELHHAWVVHLAQPFHTAYAGDW